MLGNQKNAIWEALLLTIVVFIFGIFLGMAFEDSKFNEINEYYSQSELSLMDVIALNNLLDLKSSDCNLLIKSNTEFADKIYAEATLLEKYESSGKITSTLKIAHKKYDLLRTFLWINSIKIKDKCPKNYSFVVYLYEYEQKDLTQKAKQGVWSNVLFDLKQEEGNKIILIPIAVDSNLTSLNSIVSKFNISEFPVIIINNKDVITELSTTNQLKKYLS
ncbi:MAG: hypothetical protein AABW81_02595 [Nanoarchaeota archaeon]